MHLRTNLKPLAWILACAAATLGALPLSAAADTLDVKVGFAAPLTGANAGYGKDLQNGVQLALDEANAKKIQIGGKTANFVIQAEDDQADPRIGVQAAQKLVDGGVAVVVGHFNSGTTIPASQVYQTAGIPVIDPAATNPTITQRRVSTTSSPSFPATPRTPATAGTYAVTVTKAKKIAIIDDRTAFGQGEADEFEKAVKAARRHDHRASVQRQPDRRFQRATDGAQGRGHRPDLLRRPRPASGGRGEADEAAWHQRAARGRRRRDGCGFPEARRRCSRRRMAWEYGSPLEKLPQGKAFAEKFQKHFGVAILSYAPFGYDAAWAAINAMQKANSIDPKAYRPVLKTISFPGITGTIAFDNNGALKNASSTMYQVKSGAWVPIVTKSGT